MRKTLLFLVFISGCASAPPPQQEVVSSVPVEIKRESAPDEWDKYHEWERSLSVQERTRLHDWMQAYKFYRYDLQREPDEARYKATQQYGIPPDPPVTPPAGDYTRKDAMAILSASLACHPN